MTNDNETVEHVCEKMDNESGEYHIDDYGLSSYEIGLYKERILAAHKRELAAKDAEIESMRRTVKYYEGVVSAKCKENESGRTLIKELTDALEKIYNSLDYDIEYGSCGGFVITEDRFNQSELGELIEKAKKEVK